MNCSTHSQNAMTVCSYIATRVYWNDDHKSFLFEDGEPKLYQDIDLTGLHAVMSFYFNSTAASSSLHGLLRCGMTMVPTQPAY